MTVSSRWTTTSHISRQILRQHQPQQRRVCSSRTCLPRASTSVFCTRTISTTTPTFNDRPPPPPPPPLTQPDLNPPPLPRESNPFEAELAPASERWRHTPVAMKGKFRINPVKDPSRTHWIVNEDPVKLDEMYIRFLGRGGDSWLDTETKWLAITHKSFDFGRRGFNARLAYFGRNIIIQEVAQYILTLDQSVEPPRDPHGRQPFRHPALDRLNNYLSLEPASLIHRTKLYKFGLELGLSEVMRWKPRMPENLSASGIEVVVNQALYAIIGAVALQQGAAIAGKVVRNRILKRMHYPS